MNFNLLIIRGHQCVLVVLVVVVVEVVLVVLMIVSKLKGNIYELTVQ